MLLRNGDLADAIAALEAPFLKIKSPSSHSGQNWAAAMSQLAYLYNRSGQQ
jgi:hypothetical protein